MLVENTPIVLGRRIEEGSLLQRYHSEIVQSYTRKNENRVFASHFLQGSAHYTQVKRALENRSFGDTLDSILAPLSIPALINASRSIGSVPKPQNISKNVGDYANLKPCIEKVKPGKKKTKKAKSGKRRRTKSTMRKRKIHKLHENEYNLNHNSMKATETVAKSTDLSLSLNLSSQQLHNQENASLSTKLLPPAISPYAKPFNFIQKEKAQSKSMSTNEPNQPNIFPSVSKSKPGSFSTPASGKNEDVSLLVPYPPHSSISPNTKKKILGPGIKKISPPKLQSESKLLGMQDRL